ncbi:MAG: asparagine synthase (glutamine-hydrolyzing) [Desulfobulbaceae bacterium]|nr:asparagine synthase (glutamine-hydrolyzing) [Desulfobulbaceae bacterium]
MCGIAGIFGPNISEERLRSMVEVQVHRGPDGQGIYLDPKGRAGLGHCRLRIIDLSDAGHQPMVDPSGRYVMAFNGEIYNYIELRRELESSWQFRTKTDSEVLLAAYLKWGEGCLDRLMGMFSFFIWDSERATLFAARDRFGVKPFYYGKGSDGCWYAASEIKALHRGGVPKEPDELTWASYLTYGVYDHDDKSFWRHISKLPPGHFLTLCGDDLRLKQWYNLPERVGAGFDERPIAVIKEEYFELLKQSIRLRFRSDVEVGINLSGGLDSSALFTLVKEMGEGKVGVNAFTFITGDERYDELPWVRQIVEGSDCPLITCLLRPEDVPGLASEVSRNQDEPFGGFPTLAYARLFQTAREMNVIVLLDGQGMDEQLAGYDYYSRASAVAMNMGPVQGSKSSATLAECLQPDFRGGARPLEVKGFFNNPLQNLQYRDIHQTKIPRALRFNDRVSMMYSCELREPFLDHRMVELGFRLPERLKIKDGKGKWLLRDILTDLLPAAVGEAPKRPVQTPQREWLQSELASWGGECIDQALSGWGGLWFDRDKVHDAWRDFTTNGRDNSFPFWQWISLGLLQDK